MASLAFAGLSAGYAWLVGPLLAPFGASGLSVSSQAPGGQMATLPSLSWLGIASPLVMLGLVRVLPESLRTHLSARLQRGVVFEFRGKISLRIPPAHPAGPATRPPGELASRIQLEVHGVRTVLQLGVTQGMESMGVATALATVAIEVDSALATPGLLLLPWRVALSRGFAASHRPRVRGALRIGEVGRANRQRFAQLTALLVTLSCAATVAAAPTRADMDLAVRDLGAEHDRATAAIYTLQAGGTAAAEAIAQAWPAMSLLAQKRAISALRALAREHDTAVQVLVEAARSDDASVRELGLAALRKSTPRGRDGLVVLLADPGVGDRAAALLARDEPDFAVDALLRAMSADGGPDRRALRDALTAAVVRAGAPQRKLAAWLRTQPPAEAVASAAMGISASGAHRDVLASFVEYALPEASDFATAWRLLQSAGAAGPSASIDRWCEAQLTAPKEWMLRASAVDAVTARGRRGQARLALRDPYPRVRLRAATSLSGDPSSLLERATLARRDVWPMVRASAVTSLRSEGDALPVVVAAVDDSMSVVRVAAIDALVPRAHDEGWDRIHARLRAKNEWPNVTAAAIEYVVAHCRTDAAESLFRVVMRASSANALTEDLNNAARAIEALRALGTPEAEAVIAQLRATAGVPPTLKMALDRPPPTQGVCGRPGT